MDPSATVAPSGAFAFEAPLHPTIEIHAHATHTCIRPGCHGCAPDRSTRAGQIRRATWTRASLNAAWPPRSATSGGISAFDVKPFAVCLDHRPLASTQTP